MGWSIDNDGPEWGGAAIMNLVEGVVIDFAGAVTKGVTSPYGRSGGGSILSPSMVAVWSSGTTQSNRTELSSRQVYLPRARVLLHHGDDK
uniref:Uncharacterized protein n=1 Tax=Oryza punctata TaxID=4537 RepID=A0A0E0MLX1_ORYPU